MKSGFPTGNTIRQYLLGRLDDQKDLESSLSEQMLFDHELSELVDSMEDEIIDDYLDGALNAADRSAVEEYFLRPPQRQEKLRFARALRDHFESRTGPDNIPLAVLKGSEERTGGALAIHWRSHLRTYCEIAVLILLAASTLVYLARFRHGLEVQMEAGRKAQMQLEDELTQEREHSTSLARQLRNLQPTVAVLAFLGHVLRDEPKMPQVQIKPYTEQIRVEIDLQGASANVYDVRLENRAGKQIWSQAGLKPSAGGLRFDVPTQPITAGEYCFVLNRQPQAYCFQAKISR